jgi:hypothetical protein
MEGWMAGWHRQELKKLINCYDEEKAEPGKSTERSNGGGEIRYLESRP